MPKFTPSDNRYNLASLRQYIFSSRPMFAILFGILFIVGIFFIIKDNTIFQSIGASLIASSIVSLATVWIDYIRNGEQVRADDLLKTGIQEIFPRRDLEEYKSYVEKGSEIWVTGYTLRAFTESNEQIFRDRIQRNDKFNVRLLLVNPNSSHAKVMEEAENQKQGHSIDCYQSLKEKFRGFGSNIELRILDQRLSIMIYRIDNILYTGMYPQKGASRNAYTIKLEDKGSTAWMYHRHLQEFETLWNEAREESLNL